MGISRREFLRGAAVAGFASMSGRSASASPPPVLEHHRVWVRHPDLHGLRIVHLSDLHVHDTASTLHLERGVRLANSVRPDLTVITGDLVTWGTGYFDAAAETLARLRAPLRVVTLGNHDHYADADRLVAALRARELTVLRNESLVHPRRGARLRVVGVDDLRTGHADAARATADLGSGDSFRLGLGHVPDTVLQLPAESVDLFLAGHTHGGQIAIPGLTPLVVRLSGAGYVRGFYDTPAGRLYVNRGWGTVGLPIRIGAPAEIAVFHLVWRPGAG